MKVFIVLATLTLVSAVEVPHLLHSVPMPKPEQQLPENVHGLITSHINQLLNAIHKQQAQKNQQQHSNGLQTSQLHGTVQPQVGHVGAQVLQAQVPLVSDSQKHAQHNAQQAQQHNPQILNHQATGVFVNRKNTPTHVPQNVQDVVNKVEQHVPHVISHHLAQDVHLGRSRINMPEEVNNQNVAAEKSVVKLPQSVQNIVSQVHQHVPQLVNQHLGARNVVQEKSAVKVPQLVEEIVSQVQHNEHLSRNVNQEKSPVKVPYLVEEIVSHVQQHVPQLVNQHLDQNADKEKSVAKVPHLEQNIVSQVQQHVPQVVNHHLGAHNVGQEKLTVKVPQLVEEIVTEVQQHVPQVINQQLAQNAVVEKSAVKVPQSVENIVSQVQQHIPQVVNEHLAQKVAQEKSAAKVPQSVQNIVNEVQQHVPQLISQHLATKPPSQVSDRAILNMPTIHISLPGQAPIDVSGKVQKLQQHVQEVMQHAQTHIPKAIKQQIAIKQKIKEQREKEQQQKEHQQKDQQQNGPQMDSQSQIVNSSALTVHQHTGRSLYNVPSNVPSNVQHMVQQVHHHVPYLMDQNLQHIPRKCDFQCSRFELSVCATNGKCVREFNSQCELSKWNCLNTIKAFHQVNDSDCQDEAKVRCYPGDM